MNRKYLTAILFLLTIIAPFAVSADRFSLEPADLEPGKTATLQFVLDNSREYYGFQTEVTLPAGLQAVKRSDGELDITLSGRADGGEFKVNSNVLADGSLIMGAFSANHRPFSGTDGVLVGLNVSVSESFAGGNVELSNVMFIDSQDKDVEFDSTSAWVGVAVTGITLSNTELNLTEGESATLTATVNPSGASDKTVTWT
ncbi:MAG: Ig-like domain-containing protein, partial [Muribaculaceae bacterium]|nr:Ig-like domain-containing protein [Muribaculaceae bacterium]